MASVADKKRAKKARNKIKAEVALKGVVAAKVKRAALAVEQYGEPPKTRQYRGWLVRDMLTGRASPQISHEQHAAALQIERGFRLITSEVSVRGSVLAMLEAGGVRAAGSGSADLSAGQIECVRRYTAWLKRLRTDAAFKRVGRVAAVQEIIIWGKAPTEVARSRRMTKTTLCKLVAHALALYCVERK